MDVIQLLITVVAVLGMIVVGLLAVIPTALELRDVAGSRGTPTPMVRAVADASLGRTAVRDLSAHAGVSQLGQTRQQPVDVVGGVVQRKPGPDRATAA